MQCLGSRFKDSVQGRHKDFQLTGFRCTVQGLAASSRVLGGMYAGPWTYGRRCATPGFKA